MKRLEQTPEVTWLNNWEKCSSDTIDVKRCYIDLAGDLVAGVMLSQIIYWHLPGKNDSSKLRVSRDGALWIAKKRDEWWEECRISARQVDRAAQILEDKSLIFKANYKFAGTPCLHVRLNYAVLVPSLRAMLESPLNEGDPVKSTLRNGEVDFTDSLNEFQQKSKDHVHRVQSKNTTKITHDKKTACVQIPPEHESLLSAIAKVCCIDLKWGTPRQKKQLEENLPSFVEMGVTEESIQSFGEWWKRHDWRGQRHEPPKPVQIRETWPTFLITPNHKGSPTREELDALAEKYRTP